MTKLDLADLATVTGGFQFSDNQTHANDVIDRHRMTPWNSMHQHTYSKPLEPLVRHPNDLSHQAGLDDLRSGRWRRGL